MTSTGRLRNHSTGRTLLDHAALIGDLEDLLGVKVDVIDADGMRPRFRATRRSRFTFSSQ